MHNWFNIIIYIQKKYLSICRNQLYFQQCLAPKFTSVNSDFPPIHLGSSEITLIYMC